MPSSHIYTTPASPARAFATTAYLLDGEGDPSLRPRVLPTLCSAASEAPGSVACRIRTHHFRDRKTGPGFPVVVLRCAVHQRAFTLYPLGHRPYGRVALAPVCVDGEPRLLHEPADDDADAAPISGPTHAAGSTADRPPPSLRLLVFSATLFAAALDAASGRAWPREGFGQTVPHALWETQGRRLHEAARLLGIAPAPPVGRGELLALRLGVPRLALLGAGEAYRDAPGFLGRGQVICSVLDRLPQGRCLLDRLLAAGALAGCWGPVSRWEPAPCASRGPRRVLFPAAGATAM